LFSEASRAEKLPYPKGSLLVYDEYM